MKRIRIEFIVNADDALAEELDESVHGSINEGLAAFEWLANHDSAVTIVTANVSIEDGE